jgi:hypothetical protein
MKNYLFFFIVMSLFLLASAKKGEFFQVISSHPHDLEVLTPFIETTYKNGRLWVVSVKNSAPKEIFKYLKPLTGGEKSYLHQPLRHKDLMELENSEIKDIIQNVDKLAIKKDVEKLSSFRTRAAGTQENRDSLLLVQTRFKEMGYEVKEVCHRSDACSFIADKKGSQFSDKILMVMGHIDSVGEDFAGADDNASGTAVILEMARLLSSYSNKKTIRFFVTNGEEQGLLGATYYARLLEKENRLKALSLVINMDMVGYNSNGIVELETDAAFESLAQWFAGLAARYTKLTSKITLGAWGSDHVPFLRRGVPTVLTIENWDTKTPCYHQECDRPETLNYDYAAEITKLNLSAVLERDQVNFLTEP